MDVILRGTGKAVRFPALLRIIQWILYIYIIMFQTDVRQFAGDSSCDSRKSHKYLKSHKKGKKNLNHISHEKKKKKKKKEFTKVKIESHDTQNQKSITKPQSCMQVSQKWRHPQNRAMKLQAGYKVRVRYKLKKFPTPQTFVSSSFGCFLKITHPNFILFI